MFFLNEGDHCSRDAGGGPGGQQDLEQLKPNVVLETLKSWIPGLTKLGYRLLVAALIVCIGFQICENVAEDAGAESDPHGYGSFHTQVYSLRCT